jgi:hypothetical protein
MNASYISSPRLLNEFGLNLVFGLTRENAGECHVGSYRSIKKRRTREGNEIVAP